MRARVIAVKTEERNLRPGDLYSDKGPEFWTNAMRGAGMAPQMWIMPNRVQFDSNDPIYRLTIVTEEGAVSEVDPQRKGQGVDPSAPPGVTFEDYRR